MEKHCDVIHDCVIRPMKNPQRRRDKVYIGCGAGFGGDRPMAALKLLHRVKELNYLVLECLAERTLAERYQSMMSGGDGFDSRKWMEMLLPLAVERGTCIITNMGAMNPVGAQEKVIEIANNLGLTVTVAVAHEVSLEAPGSRNAPGESHGLENGINTYLGASPIVECLEKYKPGVIITSRVADAALFLGPMVYELGWNWDNFDLLAQGTLAGHLLECGCQLTGGYIMHPGDKHRDMSFSQLLSVSLPFVEVNFSGEICVAKPDATGGLLNFSTCAEQLLYEIGDPSTYITPDLVLDIRHVTFQSLSNNKVLCTGAKPSTKSAPETLLQLVMKDSGWKGWGEISYGGSECVKRAQAAEFLVRSWMEEVCPGVSNRILSYIIGVDSLKTMTYEDSHTTTVDYRDIRLRMDGLFELKEQAIQFTREFTALYTNGPASGGGISTGYKREILMEKHLVARDLIFWKTGVKTSNATIPCIQSHTHKQIPLETQTSRFSNPDLIPKSSTARPGQKISLHEVAHSRTGDKGNNINFSIIPHFPPDLERLKTVITPSWVKSVLAPLVNASSYPQPDDIKRRDEWVEENVKVEIYEVQGIHSLNVMVHNILDGGG
ncbi:hypothetical protein V2J09_005186 [Rumex salicifolius]